MTSPADRTDPTPAPVDMASLPEAKVPGRKVKRGDLEIAYWVYGKGAPLLLITGLGMPASTWGPLPTVLARRGYRVVVIDNRDCGASSSCEGVSYTIADMAGDVLAVLDDAGISTVDVFGLSMGGFIAQELALAHPKRVARMMLLATGPGIGGGLPPDTEVMDAFFNPPPGQDSKAATEEMIKLLTGPGWAEANPRLVAYAINRRIADASEIAAVSRQWMASLAFSSWDRLDQLKMPVVVMHGDSDRLLPFGNGENLASRIAGAKMVKLKGAGHLLPLERPSELLAEIDGFFDPKGQ